MEITWGYLVIGGMRCMHNVFAWRLYRKEVPTVTVVLGNTQYISVLKRRGFYSPSAKSARRLYAWTGFE